MKTRLPIILMAVFTVIPLLGQIASAQTRAEDGIYLRPRLGMSYYLGDNEKSPFNFDGDLFEDGFPYSLGLEIGYRFKPTYEVGLTFAFNNTPGIHEFIDQVTPVKGAPNTKQTLQLMARHRYGDGKVAFYMMGGAALGFGERWHNDPNPALCGATALTTCPKESQIYMGPVLGLGLDFALSKSVSFFIETGANYFLEVSDIDGTEANGFGPGDFLGWNAIGLQFALKSFVPAKITDLICPATTVDTGVPTTFTASVDPKSSKPVVGTWNFGDGGTATGLTASHTFTRAGSFDVAFTATNGNGKGTDSRICVVTAKDPCVKADIVSMTASNMSPDTRTAISFSANVRGTDPKEYHWDFGDGQMAMSASGSHTYAQAGTYTVKLVVTNCGGTVEKTMTITVKPYEAAICREITEMNPVFFARNSSTLTPEARQKLQENADILKECPNLNARLEGFAAPGERRPDQLSLDRAKAVEQFYVDNGIALSRLITVGMGRVQGMTSKKEGLAGYRRVDTIPIRN
jgi:outer membrane protein OmpA-like peptidoglycan-associated protein